VCAWCGHLGIGIRRSGTPVWPYVCSGCTDPIRHLLERLRAHHVPHERARLLLTDPGCEVCGIDIVTKRRDPRTHKIRALLVIDHDHECCPGERSCGRCIRGLLCSNCNVALGLTQHNGDMLRAMLNYLAAG
jgi:Recombination endonuclease VII